jgi:hypothetical protein
MRSPSPTRRSTIAGTSSRPASRKLRTPLAVSTSTPVERARSSGRPSASSSPRSMIATRSHTRSTSLSRWVLSRTETPRRRSSSSRSRTIRRPAGSSALVGSSSSSSGGPPTSACAMPRRCCMPFDIVSTRRAAASRRSTSSSSSARSAAPPRDPARRWCRISSSSAVVQPGKRNSSARYPSARRAGAEPAGVPHTLTLPLDGRTSPAALLTSVDLPAPLGPSSPTSSPSPTVRSTPRSASVRP